MLGVKKVAQDLALAGFVAGVGLVNHVDATLTAHNLAVRMAILKGFEGGGDFHGRKMRATGRVGLKSGLGEGCQRTNWAFSVPLLADLTQHSRVPPLLRLATPADAPALNAIYGYYVKNGTCTWEDTETELFTSSSLERRGPRLPVIVATVAGEIRGWGSLSRYNQRSGWKFLVENSVFIHPEHQRQGLGRLILTDLIQRAQALGYRKILARISGNQPASLGLHAALGFREVGRLKAAGEKHGQRLDCVYMERDLAEPQP